MLRRHDAALLFYAISPLPLIERFHLFSCFCRAAAGFFRFAAAARRRFGCRSSPPISPTLAFDLRRRSRAMSRVRTMRARRTIAVTVQHACAMQMNIDECLRGAPRV